MITKAKYFICGICVICGLMSCEDMLESDSSRQLFDPALDQKTDSVFYAYGIMQAMQQLADQYYFQNEMRGDLVRPTAQASTDLRDLAQFSADASNKYDSVYLYYKVINNCNYYLAHRDTTLTTGARNVVSNEYAAVASFRAWAYLQLTRQYGAVPYVTEPVTTIGQINANTSATAYEAILAGEAEMLEKLKARFSEDQLSVPTFGTTSRSIGTLNWKSKNERGTEQTVTKYINPQRCFVPLNVVLGDIYLELGEYEKAATCYYQYLRYAGENSASNISVGFMQSISTDYSEYCPIFKDLEELPTDFNTAQNTSRSNWRLSFLPDATSSDILSYIPMAVNYTMGQTTEIPSTFGYNYYGTDNSNAVPENASFVYDGYPKAAKLQVVPSQAYCDSARNAQYYYYTEQLRVKPFNWIVKSEPLGDARASIVRQGMGADSSMVYTFKPSTGYVYLYRNTTVWLHLAEALNRMGYPDAAFAVLKTGIHSELKGYMYEEFYLKDENGDYILDGEGQKQLDPNVEQHTDDKYFLTPESYELLTTTLPFLGQENSQIFRNGTVTSFIGIHKHGTGYIELHDLYSSYRYDPVLKAKIDDVYAKFNLGTPAYTKEDYINAMEDLLCDEYAMEFAFEGTRFSDLRRLAIHKNRSGVYGGGFGDKWLSRMLQNNAAGITTQNCYLPFK